MNAGRRMRGEVCDATVHYDLAIAKPALKIQAQESPKFDNVFICFGTFPPFYRVCWTVFFTLSCRFFPRFTVVGGAS